MNWNLPVPPPWSFAPQAPNPQLAPPVQLAQEWRRWEDKDHNPEYNPNGVDVWHLDPQGAPQELLMQMWEQKLKELDPNGDLLRSWTPGRHIRVRRKDTPTS